MNVQAISLRLKNISNAAFNKKIGQQLIRIFITVHLIEWSDRIARHRCFNIGCPAFSPYSEKDQKPIIVVFVGVIN